METMNTMKRMLILCVAGASGLASAVNVVGDANAKTTYLKEKTVITVTQDGTLTVTEPGEIEVLLVGGGGGGGQGVDNGGFSPGAGGGGGGVIHMQSLSVVAGDYPIVIGAGGAVNTSARPLGGDTTAFGLTAKGGGCGAKGAAFTPGADGASGGGGTMGWSSTQNPKKAIYTAAPHENLGHDGGAPVDFYTPGGGGGAGTAASGSTGGEGYVCTITGVQTYYAGGGRAAAGKGSAADNGYGGGGAGDKTGHAGVVIVSFVRSPGACSQDFSLSGGDKRYFHPESTAVAFTNNGTLTVAGSGTLEVLLVGGGGGGGDKKDENQSGAGGGAGGVVHLKNFPVTAGTYAVTIGAGGEVGANGGNTVALGFTAHGGGYGAGGKTKVGAGGSGGCGGGATTYYQGPTKNGGAAIHAADGNIGFPGGSAETYIRPGGGGGAGGPGGDGAGTTKGGCGGAGYVCDITGQAEHYAGGGGGYYWGGAAGGLGGGGEGGVKGVDGLGGGGGSNAKGGSGVVILRYAKKAYVESFDDATGGELSSFARDGKLYRVHTFTENGQFVLPRAGRVEILLVGGGGGGGAPSGNTAYASGGGGGGGGVVHQETLVLEAGTHDIAVGSGGEINTGSAVLGGGDTTAFGFTAKGGGCGAKGEAFTPARDGASGGGGSKGWSSERSPGLAIYKAAPYENLGNDGGAAENIYKPGGGGGAGAPATGVNGGDGYACGIAGMDVHYAGGGGGSGANGLGFDNYGGGGRSGMKGQDGVVIVCHEMQSAGFLILVK